MAVRRNYRINLRNYGNPPAIMVSQYDENYDLVFEVFDGVVPATGLNAYTVKLVGRQPGEDPALKYEFTGTVSGLANNILSFTIDTTMTGRAGKGTAEIVILDTTNDVKFASFNLPVYVEKAAVPDDAIDADVERAQEIADEVQDIVDTAAAEVKGEAESWAVGQRDGEDVPSTDPTYHNNAKYYSEVAQDIADSIGIDATLSISGKAADAKKTGDEISSLKEDLNAVETDVARLPSVKDSDAEDVDLDVSDVNGNVIVRFADGHIKTKNFDSSQINVDIDTDTAVMSQITDGDADLYIADAQGKGLVRFADGHVQTAEFTSDNGVYKKVFEYTDTAGTATINHFFPKGTRLAFHLVRTDVAGWVHLANYNVTYKYTNKSGTVRTLGADYGYNFPTYTLPEDAVSVSVAYGTGLTQHVTKDLAFCVYPEASFDKKTKIVTVSPDGSKDFTTIREAVDSIPVDVCELNPYEIHVYPATYDILADYSDAEIMTDGFEGLYLNNGVSIIGIGSKDEIVLMGILDTDDYDNTKRNAVSTLNISGNVLVDNVTITAENIRYAIHDEGSLMTHKYNVHRFRNLKMYGYNLTSGSGGNMSYGAGCSSYKQVECDNVDFGDAMGLHSQHSMSHENSYVFRNCSARLWNLADYNSIKDTHCVMDNCKASVIRITMSTNGTDHDQFMRFDGIGTCGALVKCPAGYVYNLGDCQKFDHANISAGYAVSIDSIAFSGISVTNNLADIYGISVGVIDGYTVVQTGGYINSNILGLTGLSVGDYLTIDNTGKVVSGGTVSNAVAIVKMVDTDSVAYAKLMI